LRFTPLASGSKANSYLIESREAKILVDFGLSVRQGIIRLGEIGVSPEQLDGIFVTHIHTDHIKNVCKLAAKYNIPVYANDYTIRFLRAKETAEPDYEAVNGKFRIKDIDGSTFPTFHDAPASVGVSVVAQGKRATVITDTGKVSPLMLELADDSTVLVLESNYDKKMLSAGPYPEYLKKRIASAHGHLSNDDALAVVSECGLNKLEVLYLGHLSAHNNDSRVVERIFNEKIIAERGQNILVKIAQQDSVSFSHLTEEEGNGSFK
jgi:phosphoribosyl 1,2-cyclic phosphodiesterase